MLSKSQIQEFGLEMKLGHPLMNSQEMNANNEEYKEWIAL